MCNSGKFAQIFIITGTVYKLANQRRHPIHSIILLYTPSVDLKLIGYEQQT